jgi:hypothetical protein
MALPEFLVLSVHLVALLQVLYFHQNHLKLTILVKRYKLFMQFTLLKEYCRCPVRVLFLQLVTSSFFNEKIYTCLTNVLCYNTHIG